MPKCGMCAHAVLPRTGFVMVKKVPGTLHFAARSEGHSFDHSLMNMTHVVHQYYVGARPTPRKYQVSDRGPELAGSHGVRCQAEEDHCGTTRLPSCCLRMLGWQGHACMLDVAFGSLATLAVSPRESPQACGHVMYTCGVLACSMCLLESPHVKLSWESCARLQSD